MKKSIPILTVPISQINYVQLLTEIKDRLENQKQTVILVAAVHFVMECQYNPLLLSQALQAHFITPDGMPLVWLSKLFGNKSATRVYGPNLTIMLCGMAEKLGLSVFFVGGAKNQNQVLKKVLVSRFPKLTISGGYDTPVRPIPEHENKKIISKINRSKADIVIVGLGCPLQEKWILENKSKVNSLVLVGVGAAFDFITGYIKQAPVWLQNLGLEWFFRLLQDPKRLLKRYTQTNLHFCALVSKQIVNDLFRTTENSK